MHLRADQDPVSNSVASLEYRMQSTGAALTRKSTPIVALASSSGSHCSSEKRRRRLLFPTDELPISRSLQLMGGGLAAFVAGTGGMFVFVFV